MPIRPNHLEAFQGDKTHVLLPPDSSMITREALRKHVESGYFRSVLTVQPNNAHAWNQNSCTRNARTIILSYGGQSGNASFVRR